MRTLIQYLVPQHALSRFAERVATCRCPKIKNWIIRTFIKKYNVDLTQAELEKVEDYPDFNTFFTRKLKPELRPIDTGMHSIVSPADGAVSQAGYLNQQTLLQAKGFYYDLDALLGKADLAQHFNNGAFSTIYLSPKDYHRVHMPYPGKLRQTIYIPGQLFSVNARTTQSVPNLFTRNERLVCIFDTHVGPMAVILVGAMLVGNINTVWDNDIIAKTVTVKNYPNGIELAHGAELGHFKMGSTVIMLFGKGRVTWSDDFKENTTIKMGQKIGTVISS